ncbi:MAG: helix-turn-helix transcriptional regulator [Leisingera sp.]
MFFDAAAGEGPPLDRSFARSVLGGYLDKAKPGLIWYKSMNDQEADPALDRFHAARRLAELAVIPLSLGKRHTDFLELHFASRPGAVQQALLNIVSDTLVRTWTNRSPGLYTEACLTERRLRRNAEVEAHLLSMENPAQLSRAEYRVCVLLSKGQPAKRVQTDLGISKSTLRTHLRNIYAKTRTSNLTELVYHLVSVDTFAGRSPRRGTAA